MRRFISLLTKIGIVLLAVVFVLAIVYAFLPKGPRDPVEWNDPTRSPRSPVEARTQAAVTGTPWATEAAMNVMDAGGNAFDAAVAALLMLNVTAGEAASFPGIAPTLIYEAGERTVSSYTGAGTAPEAATIDYFESEGHETVPDLNILAQLLPASPDVMVRLLADHGTMGFEEVARPAISRARAGFPVTATMKKNLDFSFIERIGFSVILPYNAEVYLDGQWWRPIHEGSRFTRTDLASTWEDMVEAERRALETGATRLDALQAVRTHFYEGPAAQAMLELHEEREGLFTAEDLSGYRGEWETPYRSQWSGAPGDPHDYEVYTNTGWTQGIVVPLALNILQEVDVASLGHNSSAYVHAVVQALDLALADRDAYVGDPDFVDVPVDTLLSDEYAASRREAMIEESYGGLPAPGTIDGYEPWIPQSANESRASDSTVASAENAPAVDFAVGRDTSQLVIADAEGNMIAITPSDFPKSPMVENTGMTLGNRMVQFRLHEDSPTALVPGKRPRVTPHAVMVFRDGEPWLAFNTPGGDMQTQALVQVLLNMTVFEMDLQDAVDAPRFRSRSVPSSFAPHEAEPGVLWLEEPLYQASGNDLADRGYEVIRKDEWSNDFGAVGTILREPDLPRESTGPREPDRVRESHRWTAVADPREATWALGR